MKPPRLSPKNLCTCLGLTALTAGLGGCWGHPVERTLRGRWLGDGVEQVDDAAMAAATGWARGTSLEFSGSTLTVSIPAEEPRSGRYKVERVVKNDVTVAVMRPGGTIDRLHLKLDDDRGMRWMLGGGRAIVMRREN